jgi:adenine-specific DNA methylase
MEISKFSSIGKYEPATIYDLEMLTKAKEGLMELAMNKHPIETFDLYDLKNKTRSLSCHRMRFEQEAIKLNNLIHKLL